MRGKRYLAVTVLAWLVIILLGWYFVYDIPRMERAEAEHKEKLAEIGALLYAQNCVVCHGPQGEGVVGPPLNKEAFRGDPSENKSVYDLIHKTLNNGRPGTSAPRWVRLETGQWASYTAMPTWGRDNGGPLNEEMLAAITHFIMIGDWNEVGQHIPPPKPWVDKQGNYLWDKFPDGQGISKEASQAGKEIFVNRGCVGCHTIGSAGGNVGPDLSKVGSWGVDREFLHQWIADPPAMKERAPRYWSNYGGPYELPVKVTDTTGQSTSGASGQSTAEGSTRGSEGGQEKMTGGAVLQDYPTPDTQELPPTIMPDLGLSDQEIETLVTYLLHLK